MCMSCLRKKWLTDQYHMVMWNRIVYRDKLFKGTENNVQRTASEDCINEKRGEIAFPFNQIVMPMG